MNKTKSELYQGHRFCILKWLSGVMVRAVLGGVTALLEIFVRFFQSDQMTFWKKLEYFTVLFGLLCFWVFYPWSTDLVFSAWLSQLDWSFLSSLCINARNTCRHLWSKTIWCEWLCSLSPNRETDILWNTVSNILIPPAHCTRTKWLEITGTKNW